MLSGFNPLEELLEIYDPSRDLSFNNVKFRPGAKRTTPFGIDITTPQYTPLRIHDSIDSAWSTTTGYDIYNPFTCIGTEFLDDYISFGSMLILHTSYGFSIRIAHMNYEELTDKFKEALDKNKPFKAKALIGKCGNKGLSFGKHAHVTVVSDGIKETVLNDILKEKYGKSYNKSYTTKQINVFIAEAGLSNEEGWKLYNKEVEKRNIYSINNLVLYRKDYLTGEDKYFYSSMALFGM